MLKRIIKWTLILFSAGLIIVIGYILYFLSAFGLFDKDYSVTELVDNFNKRQTEIYELKKYFNEIVPKDRFVDIEFENGHKLSSLKIQPLDTTTGERVGQMFLEWDLKTNTSRMDSIIKPLGWTRETLKNIKERLDKANCIQIESGDPSRIGFKRCEMGMYIFNVFDKPIADSLKSNYNDSCTYILVNEKLVLEYASGVYGRDCFYNKR
jgi:hypothetical protein